jgi:Reverse transcriptase (RNA-dependent DNA polymerase)
LVAGRNWTVIDKEDIYSGVVCMDTVRIGFFLGELYGLSCCACDIGNAFLYGKTKEKVNITAAPEFGTKLYGKALIIDKSLYGLKTSAARFHEHLAESLLRLGLKRLSMTQIYG